MLAGALSSHGFIGDIGWDVSNGLWILSHGRVPLHNYLTTAMYGTVWNNAEWLWGVITAVGFRARGILGVYLIELPVLAMLGWLVARAARPLGPYWQVLVSLLTGLALAPAINPRPQIASFALFLMVLLLVSRYRASGRTGSLWVAAASALLWVNLHGSVVLVPIVLGLELVFTERAGRRHVIGPLLLSVLLLGAHPGGFVAIFQNFHHVASNGNTAVIAEWHSPDFHEYPLWLGTAALLGGLSVLVPVLYMRRRLADLVLFLGCALAMLWAVRFLPYLVLVVLVRGIEQLPSGMRAEGDGQKMVDPALQLRSNLVGALAAAGLLAFVGTRPIFPPRMPTGALGYLRSHHIRRVFNWYSVGAALEPFGVMPFVDGRDNLWVQSTWWNDYVEVTAGQFSVTKFLSMYDPADRYVLWFARSPVALVLDRSANWRRVYTDPNRLNAFASIQGPYVIWERVP